MCAPTAFAPAARWMGAVSTPWERMLLLADLRARKAAEAARNAATVRTPGDAAALQTRYALEMMNDYRAFWTPMVQRASTEAQSASDSAPAGEPQQEAAHDPAPENDAAPMQMAS